MAKPWYDRLVKVFMLGDSGVGKTSILRRLMQPEEKLSEQSPTIGIDFGIKNYKVEGEQVKLQVWDTAGMEQYNSAQACTYRNCHAMLLVYSVDNPVSLEKLKVWRQLAYEYCPSDIHTYVVANKCDIINDRNIPTELGKDLANSFGARFVEVSSKNGTNVESMFKNIVDNLILKEKGKNSKEKTIIDLNNKNLYKEQCC